MSYFINSVIFALVFILIYACEKDDVPEYLAKVGDEIITTQEFTYRYNFNPFLFRIDDEGVAKKTALASVIAEKLLSREAKKQSYLPQKVKRLIAAHKREAIIEQLRRDSVESQIRISEKELNAEYMKALKEITVEYFEFDKLSSARAFRAKLSKGFSLQEIREGDKRFAGIKAAVKKKLQWPISNPVLEPVVYQLKLNEISEPLFDKGRYYLVKVRAVKNTNTANSADFKNRKNALEDHILRRKIKERYTTFFYRHLQSRLGSVNHTAVDEALDDLAMQIDFRRPSPSRPFGEFKGLSADLYLSTDLQAKQRVSTPAVKFPSAETWTLQELFRNLKTGPYAFNYSDINAFKKSFLNNINLLLEHQALYEMARELDYEVNENVRKETAMWQSYYSAASFRHHLLEPLDSPQSGGAHTGNGNLSAIQKKRLDFMDKYLSALISQYEIDINKSAFMELQLKKQDMLLMKSHFAHRLVAPLLEPLEGMPHWQKKINILFTKFGIN